MTSTPQTGPGTAPDERPLNLAEYFLLLDLDESQA